MTDTHEAVKRLREVIAFIGDAQWTADFDSLTAELALKERIWRYSMTDTSERGRERLLDMVRSVFNMPEVPDVSDTPCEEIDCQRDTDDCPDCFEGSLYLSPDAYEIYGMTRDG